MIVNNVLAALKTMLALCLVIAGCKLLIDVYNVHTAKDLALVKGIFDLAKSSGISIAVLLFYNGVDAIHSELRDYEKHLDEQERGLNARVGGQHGPSQ